MAKAKLTEKVTETHALTAEGILNLDNATIEIEEVGIFTLEELLVNFNGKNVKVSVQTKTEKDIEE